MDLDAIAMALGKATKAENALGWKPKTTFTELVKIMVQSDLQLAKHEALIGLSNH